VKELGFAMLHNEASIDEDFGHNVVAIEKKERR